MATTKLAVEDQLFQDLEGRHGVKVAARLLDAFSDVRCTENELRSAAERLADSARRVVKDLDENLSLNSLGEVQGRGLTVDLLCAQRELQVKHVLALAAMVDERDTVAAALDAR
jgi:hypothetical protein